MDRRIFLLLGMLFFITPVFAKEPINFLINMNTINITTINTSDEIHTAINNSGYYNITSQECYYVDNATERSAFLSTYNVTYDTGTNSSWNESRADALYLKSFAELDPRWAANYSLFNDSWTTTFNTTYDAGLNASWNESHADTLYYSLTNPFDFYNSTTFPFYNNLSIDDITQDNTSWNQTLSDTLYYALDNPFGFYNSTSLPYFLNYTYNATYDALVTDNVSWNESYANSLYYLLTNPYAFINDTTWQYNQTQPAMDYCDDTFITQANEENLNVNNSTYWSNMDIFPTLYEANISDLQSYLLVESDPAWYANYTLFNTSWSSTFNSTYDAGINASFNETLVRGFCMLNTTNSSYYLATNPSQYLNESAANEFYMRNTTNTSYATWLTNYTQLCGPANLTACGLNTSNSSYILTTNTSVVTTSNLSYVLTSNISYLQTSNTSVVLTNNLTYVLTNNATYNNHFNTTAIANLNMSNYNITTYGTGKIVLYNSTGKASCLYANDTYSFIIDTVC